MEFILKQKQAWFLSTLAAGILSSAAQAGVIDPMNSASNFVFWTKDSVATNTTSATVNGNGTVTLTRNTALDSGANWYAAAPITISSDTDTLVLTLSSASTGTYMAVIHYFGANGSTIANDEYTWVNWTASTATKTLDSVLAHAPSGAVSYYVKFRVQNGQSLTIDNIAAIPEAATCGILVAGLSCLLMRSRK